MDAADYGAADPAFDAQRASTGVPGCCGPGAMFGWSPPALPAETNFKRRVDRMMPRTGLSFVMFFAVVIALLNVGVILPRRLALVAIGVAGTPAGIWCAVNFWPCRYAHCVITGAGWLALAAFSFLESGLGRSLIHGDEGLMFLGVLGVGLAFEGAWYRACGTNAVSFRSSWLPAPANSVKR